MSATVNDLATLFVLGGSPMRSGSAVSMTVETDGTKTFRSYGVPIARWVDGKLQVTTKKYSMTTSRHTSAVRNAAVKGGVQFTEVDF